MKIPKFKNESEEADWFYANRDKIKWGTPIVDAEGKPVTVADIIAKQRRNELDARAAEKMRTGKAKPLTEEMLKAQLKPSQPVTIRLSVADIDRAKAQAERKGLGYQTYLKSLIHQALTTE